MDNQESLSKKETDYSSVLITGGHGLLGNSLSKLLPMAHRPTHELMDIHNNLLDSEYFKAFDSSLIKTVIHCVAKKNEFCTKFSVDAMLTNVVGTANVVAFCNAIKAKIVYISTDYVFRGDRGGYRIGDEVGPINYYGETKLAGEYVAKSLREHLIIRLSFFPDVFPYEKAFIDQFTTRITVTEAARRIVSLIEEGANGVRHIVGPRRSSYEYAVSTAFGKEIIPVSLSDDSLIRPKDTSLEEE